ncbi:MAG: hypothetical protein JWR62_698, partial [Modestobacter sp.]|nr:hypothetical protein [Modestobacter sp.]
MEGTEDVEQLITDHRARRAGRDELSRAHP